MNSLSVSRRLGICETRGIHEDIVENVRKKLPQAGTMNTLAEMFKLFADGTRIGILWALSESEMCVCDLCALLKMKQPAVSQQLRKLKLSKIVKTRREGKVIFYSLNDEHIRTMLDIGMEHISE